MKNQVFHIEISGIHKYFKEFVFKTIFNSNNYLMKIFLVSNAFLVITKIFLINFKGHIINS
jgi:hypothetical protein